MSRPGSSCPNCGAPVIFQWSSSVQTVCPFCKSILIRTDVDLSKVGSVADLPPDSSPIQLNTEGLYRNRSFVVIGRILYQYEQGRWNEWNLAFSDGKNGWLSDAQEEYAVSFAASISGLPSEPQLQVGNHFNWNGDIYSLSVVTKAHYRGVEGELPFPYWDKTDVQFADLRGPNRKFGTLDYSDAKPALYLGELVEFDDLSLKNLRRFEGWS